MNTIINRSRSVLNHYYHFGSEGLKFLWKKRKAKNDSYVDIRPKGLKHPIYLRNKTADVPMFYYIFEYREYDIHLEMPPKVIIDCGAHIGLSAVFFANKFPDAKIYAIEPESSNFQLLLKNTKPYSNIQCLQYGIWNTTAYLKIVDIGEGNWGFMTEEVDVEDANTIKAISIDEVVERYAIEAIDICKINIEGTEKELFEKNYEQWLSKTKTIVIELHDRMREGCTQSFLKAMMHYNFTMVPHGSYLVCTIKN